MFFDVFITTLSITMLYGLIGGCMMSPFGNKIKFPILAAPLAGMLVLAISSFLLYQWSGFSLKFSIGFSAMLFSIMTLTSLVYTRPTIILRNILFEVSVVIVCCGIFSYLNNFTSIMLGHTGFLFMEGSDHLGYAAMSDWLTSHLATNLPVKDSNIPYQSFPSLLVQIDPRFGSFITLGIISTILGISGTFVYDTACSIVLLSSCIGVAAIYSRSQSTLLILLAATCTSFWFQLAQQGYLGKILGFPALIYVLGLFILMRNDKNLSDKSTQILPLISTLVLTIAAAAVYPGTVLASFLIVFTLVFLVITSCNMATNYNIKNLLYTRDSIGILALMILAACASYGMVSLPKYILNNGQLPLNWLTTLLYQMNVNDLYHNDHGKDVFFLALTYLIIVFCMCLSLIKRNNLASAISGTVLFFIITPLLISNKWVAYELAGLLYVFSICGGIWLIDDLSKSIANHRDRRNIFFLVILMLISILIRFPTFKYTVKRFATHKAIPSMQYSKEELDSLAKTIGNQHVIVDIPNVMFALPILVEFGRRDIQLEWTPQTWKAILGYRNWQPPKISSTTHLILTINAEALQYLGLKPWLGSECNTVAQTRQYQLLNCPPLKGHIINGTIKPRQNDS